MNTMYALTYYYEGSDGSAPYGATIAVSTNLDKLRNKMMRCVDEDCEVDENDEWATDKNFIVDAKYVDEVCLQHRNLITVYAKYSISPVELIV